MEAFTTPAGWVALLTLTLLEVVLGIDNVVFISILSAKLPPEQRARARQIGLALATITRVGLLFSLAWLIGPTEPWFALLGFAVSGRDLILVAGGLFLIAKATFEIHERLEGHGGATPAARPPTFSGVMASRWWSRGSNSSFRRGTSTSRWGSPSSWRCSTCACGAPSR